MSPLLANKLMQYRGDCPLCEHYATKAGGICDSHICPVVVVTGSTCDGSFTSHWRMWLNTKAPEIRKKYAGLLFKIMKSLKAK